MAYKVPLFLVKDIIFNPIKAWETIDSENKSVNLTRNSFLFPLILLVSGSAMAGSLIFTNSELSPVYSVFVGIKCFLLFYISVYATAYILNKITFSLDLGKDFAISFRLIVYSVVPLLLCQVLSRLFESLLFVNVLALFSLYILWTGMEKILTPPANQKMPLLIASLIAFAGIFIVTDLLFTKLIDRIYYTFFA